LTVLYTGIATNTRGGRGGHAETDDGKLSFDLTPPGGSGGGTNPEQLFALGYSACFGSALKAVADKEHKSIEGAQITAKVELHKEDSGFSLAVELIVKVPGLDKAEAEKLVELAHQMCPYSKATRNNIPVKLTVE
jgi:Ohr subfamily peroxiredoxin